jgi:protein TonB
MPPIVKENENLTARPETGQRPSTVPALPGDSAVKQQPVALEVPVTVNGARAVEGSAKREPFSESTKTVLVFGTGAVIRLASSVAPGQLLFLTNEKTKKEVVCQVVKSKNYRNVSGYVELEFTEPVVGFWGMRFPGDRLAAVPRPVAPAPVPASSTLASGSPVAPRPVAPISAATPANVAPSIVPPKPVAPVSLTRSTETKLSAQKFATPAAQIPSAPPVHDELLVQKPVAPVAPLSSTLSSSFDPTAPLKLPSSAPVVPAVPVSLVPADEFKVNIAPENAAPPVLFDSPRASEVQASFLEPAKTPAVPLTPSVPNPNSLFEAKPAIPEAEPPAVQVFADPETETLKQHTARLQEQLSSLMFAEAHPAHPVVAAQTADVNDVNAMLEEKETFEPAPKVLDIHKAPTPAPVAKPVEPAKSVLPPAISSHGDEELKIPEWLEPLARNAAAPVSVQELIEREKAKRISEQPIVEEFAAETNTTVSEYQAPDLPLPTFGNTLPMDEEPSAAEESGSGSSGKGMRMAAIAAGILALAGGGWWYMQQQSGGAHDGPASNVQASVASLPVTSSPSQPQGNALPQANAPAQTKPTALTNTSVQSNSASSTPNIVPAASTTAVRNPQLSSNPARAGASLPTSASAQPVAVSEKKPILGEVHLATPKLTPRRSAQNGGEAEAGIINLTNDDEPEPNTGALNAGLVGDNKQPVAPAVPLPVGGDVVQAKLISSVPPAYPPLAKSQHISGNVLVDALIDANGRVTTMKIVSGPALLHQAAMDALKQWKYRPATLDGKPTPMHLAVTIQFRLQ